MSTARPEEVEAAKQRCPIVLFAQQALATGFIDEAELNRIAGEVQREIDEAVAFAQSSPLPEPAGSARRRVRRVSHSASTVDYRLIDCSEEFSNAQDRIH